MPIEHIVIYRCDGPECDVHAGAHEVTYHGKFPKGWLHARLAIWPSVEQGQRGGVSFHSIDCFEKFMEVHREDWNKAIKRNQLQEGAHSHAK